MSLHETRMHKKRENKHHKPFHQKQKTKNYKVSSTLLVETKISHLGKKGTSSTHSKVPFTGGCVSSQEGKKSLRSIPFSSKSTFFKARTSVAYEILQNVFFEVWNFSKRFCFLVSNFPKGFGGSITKPREPPKRIHPFSEVLSFLGKKQDFYPQTSTFSILIQSGKSELSKQ